MTQITCETFNDCQQKLYELNLIKYKLGVGVTFKCVCVCVYAVFVCAVGALSSQVPKSAMNLSFECKCGKPTYKNCRVVYSIEQKWGWQCNGRR